jgi:hypothetical protein
MSHQKHKHDKHQQQQKKKAHKDWKTWIVIGMMLLAMLLYVISDDEALPPGDPQEAGQTVPAGE